MTTQYKTINLSGDNIWSFPAEIYKFRFVLYNLVAQFLSLRYRRTVMGYLWTVFNPLLMMSVTSVVFSSLFKMDLKTYVIFLFSGMIAFTFFSSVLTQSGSSLLANEGIIKKIYVPKIIFPLSGMIGLLIDSFLTTLALLLIVLVIGGKLTSALLFLPLAYLLLFIFTLGLGLIMSILTVYFRDLQHIMAILMQLLLFLTPILYKTSALSNKVKNLIDLNPLTTFVALFRLPIYEGIVPSSSIILKALCFALISCILGISFFKKHQQRIMYRL